MKEAKGEYDVNYDIVVFLYEGRFRKLGAVQSVSDPDQHKFAIKLVFWILNSTQSGSAFR
jgi:hypothetical protein